jgi:hypothetical protein
MTPEEYKWTIDLVKDRHHQFKLTFEQAEKVYQFEQEKGLHSIEHYFSTWEEYDYTLDNFQKILNEKQLKKFLAWQKENIKRHEKFLIESDKEQVKYIDYHNELLKFYEEYLFPHFFKEKFLTDTVSLSFEKSKVEFLKKEYKAFLDSQKIGIISSHYRHSKLYQPNTLKVALLRHRLYYIIPRFSFFKVKMDEPTKATANFLLDKFQFILERHQEFFKQKEEELSSFAKSIQEKYIGEPKGWHVKITETEEQKKENQIMLIILIDIEKYGC